MFKEELLTVEEVAAIFRTTPNTIYRWLRAGKIAGIKIGKEWRINKESLMSKLAQPDHVLSREKDFLEKLETPGEHILVVTDDADTLYDFEAKFLKKGLLKGGRLFKGCWWQHPDNVRRELSLRGLPVEELESKNALVLVDLNKLYQRQGISEAVKSWSEEAKKSLDLGYSTMWGSGSPHLFSCGEDVSNLVNFESMLNNIIKELPVIGVCPYILGDCFNDFFTPIIDLINQHRSVIFYSRKAATYLKN